VRSDQVGEIGGADAPLSSFADRRQVEDGDKVATLVEGAAARVVYLRNGRARQLVAEAGCSQHIPLRRELRDDA
jgi:hypothetical protein